MSNGLPNCSSKRLSNEHSKSLPKWPSDVCQMVYKIVAQLTFKIYFTCPSKWLPKWPSECKSNDVNNADQITFKMMAFKMVAQMTLQNACQVGFKIGAPNAHSNVCRMAFQIVAQMIFRRMSNALHHCYSNCLQNACQIGFKIVAQTTFKMQGESPSTLPPKWHSKCMSNGLQNDCPSDLQNPYQMAFKICAQMTSKMNGDGLQNCSSNRNAKWPSPFLRKWPSDVCQMAFKKLMPKRPSKSISNGL